MSAEVIDLRVLSPLDITPICQSGKNKKAGSDRRGTRHCGFAAEIITSVLENIEEQTVCNPMRFTLPDFPAPTPSCLEENYYPDSSSIVDKIALQAKPVSASTN